MPSTDWTVVAGTWTPSPTTTTSDNAKTLHESGADSANYRIELFANVSGSNPVDAAVWYVYLFYEDASNHVYVKFQKTESDPGPDPLFSKYPMSCEWEIHEVIGGTDTLKTSDSYSIVVIGLDRYGEIDILEACNLDGEISIRIGTSETTPATIAQTKWNFFTSSNSSALGSQFGFGTGALDGGTFSTGVPLGFKTWGISTHCTCLCQIFREGTAPSSIQVVITGCDDSDYNGTFLLDPITVVDFSGEFWCTPLGSPWHACGPDNDDYCTYAVRFSVSDPYPGFDYRFWAIAFPWYGSNPDVYSFTLRLNSYSPYVSGLTSWDYGGAAICSTVDGVNDIVGIEIDLSKDDLGNPSGLGDDALATITAVA